MSVTPQVTLVLADYAQVADGKLNLIGAGWDMTTPHGAPFALGGLISVPWSETPAEHRLLLELVDGDGRNVLIQGAGGRLVPVEVTVSFATGPHPNIKPGMTTTVPFAINLPPQRLEPDSLYEWRATINDQPGAWNATFRTLPLPDQG